MIKKKKTVLASVLLSSVLLAQTVFAYTTDKSDWPTISSGSTGGYVGSLQADLWSSGYSSTVGAVDRSFGTNTTNGTKLFQTANSLTSDGIVGSGTWSKLESYTSDFGYRARLYRNPGSTTYETYYNLLPDGAGGESYSYYLRYRSSGIAVYQDTVWYY